MTSVSGGSHLSAGATASSVDGGAGAERCPRCGSHNTKFCYYNNYNFAQPRHFCKACRRYWTLGGSLRDVPIGGSTRSTTHRNKQQTSGRSSSSSSSRRRLLPAQGPATTCASSLSSPSVNSLYSGAPSIVRTSVAPSSTESITTASGAVDEAGMFTPLLAEPPPAGFVALRDPLLHVFDDFLLDLGLACSPMGTTEQLSSGMGMEVVAWPSFGEDGSARPTASGDGVSVAGAVHREGEAWRVAAGGAEPVGNDGDDCLGWPELAISATPGKRSGLR